MDYLFVSRLLFFVFAGWHVRRAYMTGIWPQGVARLSAPRHASPLADWVLMAIGCFMTPGAIGCIAGLMVKKFLE